jgi:large subunit ribosomal protein L2
MSVRKLKPITPGQRFRVVNGFDTITTDKPEKSLLTPKKRSGGRNNQGRMTTRNIGGGHKRRYRIIDFMTSTNITCSHSTLIVSTSRPFFRCQ